METETLDTALKATAGRFLDREGTRARVAAHLAEKRPIEELGVERNRPADTKDFAFVGMAPKRPSQSNWYRCSFCQRDKQFSEGRIVLSSDGLLRLIGNDCWNQHLDTERYALERQDYRDYERKLRFDRIRERAVPAISDTAAKLRDVLRASTDTLSFVESLPVTLRDGAPSLFRRLKLCQRDGGQLQVDRMVRDISATERSGSECFTHQAETLHIVSGLDAALGPVPSLEQDLKQALSHLYSARRNIQNIDWNTITNRRAAKEIDDIESEIRSAIRTLDVCSSAIDKANDFLDHRNVSGMVRWASDRDCDLLMDDASISALSGGFRFQTNAVFDLQRPSTLRPKMLPDTVELKRVVDSN